MDVRLTTDIARAAFEPAQGRRVSSASPGATGPDAAVNSPSAASTPAADEASTGSRSAVPATASGQFYVSPYLTFDSRALTVIFQVRDSESGDVTRQFPSESVVERYRRDPSARPFGGPETAPEGGDATQGPPPPTIGGPVAAAASEAEARGEAPAGTSQSGATGDAAGAGSNGSAPVSTGARPSVDLVA